MTEPIRAEIERSKTVIKSIPEGDTVLTAQWLGYQDGLRFALARIRETPTALTQEEAELLLWELDRDEEHPYFTSHGYIVLLAKLRLISSPTEEPK